MQRCSVSDWLFSNKERDEVEEGKERYRLDQRLRWRKNHQTLGLQFASCVYTVSKVSPGGILDGTPCTRISFLSGRQSMLPFLCCCCCCGGGGDDDDDDFPEGTEPCSTIPGHERTARKTRLQKRSWPSDPNTCVLLRRCILRFHCNPLFVARCTLHRRSRTS